MIIESMCVKNFRSILDETLNFEQLTALVGANGSGKSSFLRALELLPGNFEGLIAFLEIGEVFRLRINIKL